MRKKYGERIIRRNLPLFILTFGKGQDVKEIYNIDNILVLREPLWEKSTVIPQCKRYQMCWEARNKEL